jgi:hypothetical protein
MTLLKRVVEWRLFGIERLAAGRRRAGLLAAKEGGLLAAWREYIECEIVYHP